MRAAQVSGYAGLSMRERVCALEGRGALSPGMRSRMSVCVAGLAEGMRANQDEHMRDS